MTFRIKYLPAFLVMLVLFSSCLNNSGKSDAEIIESESEITYGYSYISGDFESIQVKYQIHFINAGQGESILILTPDKTVIIDAGDRNGIAANYLLHQGIQHIDIAIATHPHADHIGGFRDIFELFTIGELIDPGVVHTTLTFERYLTLIYELDIPFTVGRKGMIRELGEAAFLELLHPEEPSDQNLNAASIVVKLTLGNITALFTGDIERRSEEELLKEHLKLESNILKVPHHGSATSSHKAFLKAVKPNVAVIMCGTDNAYGFPEKEVLRRLDHLGSEILRTDLHGHIIIKSDGENFTVETLPYL